MGSKPVPECYVCGPTVPAKWLVTYPKAAPIPLCAECRRRHYKGGKATRVKS